VFITLREISLNASTGANDHVSPTLEFAFVWPITARSFAFQVTAAVVVAWLTHLVPVLAEVVTFRLLCH
jgi:hypothetical protein